MAIQALKAGVEAGVMLRGATAPIGAESSWPHGVGTRLVSEPSTDALKSCNSMTCATNATAAAVLRSNSTYSGLPRTLPSISSSKSISAILGSHGHLKACHSITPTSWQVGAQVPRSINTDLFAFDFSAVNGADFWQTLNIILIMQKDVCLRCLHVAGCSLKHILWLQELVTSANKARGKADTKMDTMDSHSGLSSAEDLSNAKPTDQEENLLRQFLSPKVYQPPLLHKPSLLCCQKWPVALLLQQQNTLRMM